MARTPTDLPAGHEAIEIRVGELRQVFNSIDPSPFRERDLDPSAVEFIVGWAQDLPADAPLALVVYLDRETVSGEETAILRDAVAKFFSHRAQATRLRLRHLLRVGRTSLLVGVFSLAVSIGLGGLLAGHIAGERLGAVLRESFLIGGWVAMWRPLEIFLYDWWPIRAEARLFRRLSMMPVRVAGSTGGQERESAHV